MKNYTLPNGLNVTLLPREHSAVVSIHLGYHVGSRNEDPSHTGFAHLFEHLMFGGSQHVPPTMFDTYCSMAGGENNAYTTHDKTVYMMQLPSAGLEMGLWLESDRMAAFAADEGVLATQKNVVLEEISQMVENQPYGRFGHTLNSLVWSPECPYHWDVYGKQEHVAMSELPTVKAFWERWYRPDNAWLVISGGFAPEHAEELVERYFGSIAPGTPAMDRPQWSATWRRSGGHAVVRDAIPFESTFISAHAPGFTHDDYLAFDVLSDILSDGQSSRLYKRLVRERRLASEIAAWMDDRHWGSQLVLFGVAADPSGTADDIANELLASLRAVAEKGISEQELEKVKTSALTRFARRTEKASGVADMSVHAGMFFNDPTLWQSYPERLRELSAHDVQAAAQEALQAVNRIDFIPAE